MMKIYDVSGDARRAQQSPRNFKTFFFSNFSVNYREYDMINTFQRWTRVKKVFISRRLNRWGRRFGFIRFYEVGNIRRLEKDLDQIHLGNMKLHVNIPKYRRVEIAQPVRSTRAEKSVRIHMEGRVRLEKPNAVHQPRDVGKQVDDGPRKYHVNKEVWREKKEKEKEVWRVANGKQEVGKASYAEAIKNSPQVSWKGPSVVTMQQILLWMVNSMVGHLLAGVTFNKLCEERIKGAGYD